MNDRIVTAYRETADQARDYADPDRAVATVRRRRRIRVALVVPVVAAVLGAGMLLRPQPAPPPATATISVSDPVVLAAPAEPRPLPAGATGTAALAYTPCFSGCDALVALTDGRQFVVPPDPAGVFAGTLSLSPGGAWLGYPVSDEYLVRHLTGTTVHRVPAPPGHRIGAAAWSADATRLLLADEPRAGGDAVYHLLDLTTGTTTKAAIPPGQRAVGLLADGSVLTRPSTPSGSTLTLTATGGRTYPIALGGELAAGESAQSAHLARNGIDVWIVVGTPHADVPTANGKPTAVLLAALTGTVRARYAVPASGLSEPLGPTPDGFVLSHRPEPADPGKITLVTVSSTGAREGLTIPGTEGGPVVRLPG